VHPIHENDLRGQTGNIRPSEARLVVGPNPDFGDSFVQMESIANSYLTSHVGVSGITGFWVSSERISGDDPLPIRQAAGITLSSQSEAQTYNTPFIH